MLFYLGDGQSRSSGAQLMVINEEIVEQEAESNDGQIEPVSVY